jgi:hypothetical protein
MTDKNQHFWKYNEGKILEQIQEYLIGTYNAHYVGENGVQAMDLISAIGDGIPFSRSSIIKYASRYGKKNGLSKSDCLKIIHFGIFLYHFSNHDKPTTEQYETLA